MAKKWIVRIAVNLAVLCTLLVCTEVAGQMLFALTRGHFVFDTGAAEDYRLKQVFELHPFLVGRLKANVAVSKGDTRVTTTPKNTRWTGSPENAEGKIVIAVLGGSTTFCAGVADADSWPALLQSRLGERFSVLNFGVPGYSTAEGIIQMALVVPEFRPRLVVFYGGWNDLHNYHEQDLGSDYHGHGIRQYGNLSLPAFRAKGVFEKFADVSATVRFAGRTRSSLSSVLSRTRDRLWDSPDPFVDRVYVRNLKTLKVLAEHMGAKALFVPQVLNDSVCAGKEDAFAWSPRIVGRAMPQLMRRFGGLMGVVCREDPPCVFGDGVLAEQWGPEDFLDEGHFSRKGNEKFAEYVAGTILTLAKNWPAPSTSGEWSSVAVGR